MVLRNYRYPKNSKKSEIQFQNGEHLRGKFHFSQFLIAGGDEEEVDGVGAVPVDTGDGIPPTFTEKPRIVPNETGTLVVMKFKVKIVLKEDPLQV